MKRVTVREVVIDNMVIKDLDRICYRVVKDMS